MSSEIHISGEIDNLLFGYLKDPYYAELEKSISCFHVPQQKAEDFLKIFFRDKGIRIDLTRKERPKMREENLPDLWGLTID